VPIKSAYYVTRTADTEMRAALERRDSIILLKGARQVGKTSLLARGLQQARESGAYIVFTHLQMLGRSQLASSGALCFELASALYEQLELPMAPRADWDHRRSAGANLRRYLRSHVLPSLRAPRPVAGETPALRGPQEAAELHGPVAGETPALLSPPSTGGGVRQLVWALDEVDRVFDCADADDVFGLIRSWHDERALDPDGPLADLTLVMAYSTEAHLLIANANQSPFNVGSRIGLDDFTPAQVGTLNSRHGSPLRGERDLGRFRRIVGGQPYLVRLGLYEMAAHGVSLRTIETQATDANWVFGDHLQRMGALIERDPALRRAVTDVVAGRECDAHAFQRLRSAGVIVGGSPRQASMRCGLYERYLGRRMS